MCCLKDVIQSEAEKAFYTKNVSSRVFNLKHATKTMLSVLDSLVCMQRTKSCIHVLDPILIFDTTSKCLRSGDCTTVVYKCNFLFGSSHEVSEPERLRSVLQGNMYSHMKNLINDIKQDPAQVQCIKTIMFAQKVT